MPRPKPEDFPDYDRYTDALSEWQTNDEEEEEHPWRFTEELHDPIVP